MVEPTALAAESNALETLFVAQGMVPVDSGAYQAVVIALQELAALLVQRAQAAVAAVELVVAVAERSAAAVAAAAVIDCTVSTMAAVEAARQVEPAAAAAESDATGLLERARNLVPAGSGPCIAAIAVQEEMTVSLAAARVRAGEALLPALLPGAKAAAEALAVALGARERQPAAPRRLRMVRGTGAAGDRTLTVVSGAAASEDLLTLATAAAGVVDDLRKARAMTGVESADAQAVDAAMSALVSPLAAHARIVRASHCTVWTSANRETEGKSMEPLGDLDVALEAKGFAGETVDGFALEAAAGVLGVFERQNEVVGDRPTYKKLGQEQFLFYSTLGKWTVGDDTSDPKGYWKVKSSARTPGAITEPWMVDDGSRVLAGNATSYKRVCDGWAKVSAAKIVPALRSVVMSGDLEEVRNQLISGADLDWQVRQNSPLLLCTLLTCAP
jgi:hypothetical protein